MDIIEIGYKHGINGHKLKSLRKMRGLSLSRLSELTGISKSYLSIIERDLHKNPTLDILEKLASFFQVEVEYLFKGNEEVAKIEPLTKKPVKATIKFEIELSRDQLNPRKLQQITELIQKLHEDN